MSLLQVNNLHTYLQTNKQLVKAVDGISFTINKGETYCLVGESGSGKSISALSIIQLLPAHIAAHPHGNILFQHRKSEGTQETVDMLKLNNTQLREIRGARIAMIFQEPMTSLNPVFTIGEQIMEALRLHHPQMSDEEARERTLKALEQVRIPKAKERFKDYPHRLSGGQRQRVMIAMALACEPDLLIADEPTTALDVTVQAEILRLMKELQDNHGMSILFITHDFGVVAQIAHKVGVMQQGKLVESGTKDNVLWQGQHPYTQQLLAAVPDNLRRQHREKRSKAHRTPSTPKNDATAIQGDESNDALIRVKNLQVYFPIRKGLLRRTVDYVRAVDDVSLDIPKGRIVALVGESGCGKTTLGRAILQLEKPTAGSVRFRDTELTGLPEKALRPWRNQLQIAFQDPQSSLNPRLLVATTLTEPMKVHGIGESQEERIELAAKTLENVQLKHEHLWRYPHEFSGGQRQRVGLARALCLNPEFIVCDEITSALDVSVQAETLQLLLEIRRKRDLTLLFITHNISVVEYLSDDTVVMLNGKIVEQGATDQVCGNPQETYTQKLISAVPRLSKDFMTLSS